MQETPIESADVLWEHIKQRGGLDLDRYDAGVEREIRHRLNVADTVRLNDHLRTASVSPTTLLVAFFAAVAPYTKMYRQILALLEHIGASHGESNLRVRFDFATNAGPLEFDLNHFREEVQRIQRILAPVAVEYWQAKALLDVTRALSRVQNWKDSSNQLPPEVNRWCQAFDDAESARQRGFQTQWPPASLDPPHLDDPAVATDVARVWALWKAFVSQLGVSTTRPFSDLDAVTLVLRDGQELQVESDTDQPAPPISNILFTINHDRWPQFVVRGVYNLAAHLRRGTPEGLDAASELAATIGKHPVESRTLEKILTDLDELLRLPVWQRRPELYAMWVLTQLVNAVEDISVLDEFNVQNGCFDVPFKDTCIARATQIEPTLEIVAEMRSPLDNPMGKGRVAGIQPDFAVVKVADTERTVVLVVECKQYRVAAPKRFREALTDYARGAPLAEVVLVNYGPAKHTITEQMENELANRAHPIGEFRPDSSTDSLSKFRGLAVSALRPHFKPKVLEPAPDDPGSWTAVDCHIELTWRVGPNDLDLYLFLPAAAGGMISYNSKGTLDAPPYARLEADIVTHGEPESMTVARGYPGVYRIAVHAYSHEAPLSQSRAEVRIRFPKGDRKFTYPTNGTGEWWHVADVDILQRVITARDVLSFNPPPASEVSSGVPGVRGAHY
jgi:hypothetical protein